MKAKKKKNKLKVNIKYYYIAIRDGKRLHGLNENYFREMPLLVILLNNYVKKDKIIYPKMKKRKCKFSFL